MINELYLLIHRLGSAVNNKDQNMFKLLSIHVSILSLRDYISNNV